MNNRFQNEIITYFKEKEFVIKTTKIDDGYDINEEIVKHEWADLVITQAPIFWFNTSWIHKKYIEEVFTDAWMQQRLLINDGRQVDDLAKQYGTSGISQGKKYMLSATWNAPKEAFNNKDQFLLKGKSADEVLINVSNNYKFCGFEIIDGFYSYDVVKNPQKEKDVVGLKEKLDALIKN